MSDQNPLSTQSSPQNKKTKKWIIIGLTAIFLFWAEKAIAQNLLQNPGFEMGLSPWQEWRGSLEITNENGNIHSGNAAVKFSNSTTTAYFFYQEADLEPGKNYKFSGYVKAGDNNPATVYLKVVLDGGSEFLSNQIQLTDSYQLLSTDNFAVPEGAFKGKFRAYLDPLEAQLTVAYFDDFEAKSESSPTPTPSLNPSPTPPQTINDYSNIFIFEFMPYPESGNEWVELYNGNNFEVDLYGWYIDDIADGGSSSHPISGIISPGGYKQFFLSSAYLNNSGDDVRLLDANQNEKDKTSFESSTKGKSWSKDKNGNWCQIEPTPNAANPDCPSVGENSSSTSTPTPSPSPTTSPKPTKVTGATLLGKILGEEESSPAGFYPWEATEEAQSQEATETSKTKLIPRLFLGSGLIFLLVSGIYLWYNQRR